MTIDEICAMLEDFKGYFLDERKAKLESIIKAVRSLAAKQNDRRGEERDPGEKEQNKAVKVGLTK